MIAIYIISIISIISLLLCIMFFPKITIKGRSFNTFYMPILIGAILLIILPLYDKKIIIDSLFSSSSINPIKILILFLSISLISITLDVSGFFSYLASFFIKKFKNSQIKLFLCLYIIISITTIFTSNDIVILTFTPFILYLSKKGKINPIPYLILEFVSGNTYSILLEIGNPTNIYLSSYFNIPFFTYFINMIIPTLIIGISSFLILMLLYRRDLLKPISDFSINEVKIEDKLLFIISLIHLLLVIILMAISNIINIEMWLISLIFAISLIIFTLIYSKIKGKKYFHFVLVRLPYNLVPFILSMFIIILSLGQTDLFNNLKELLMKNNNNYITSIIYFSSSFITCNIINNIPMTIFFSNLLTNNYLNIYSVIIASNLGALLLPVGSLAGIMWLKILNDNQIKFTFIDFFKNGIKITICLIPFILLSLFVLSLIV